MTGKRWEIIDEEFISYRGGTAQLISNGECEIHLWERPEDAQLFCDKLNAINEENEELKKQMQRLYNYFEDWHEDEMGGNQFSEIWDIVKEDKKWER